MRDRVNDRIRAINPVTRRLVTERTAYASQLIPVTQYVTVSCIEAFLRYPSAVEVITAARAPEEIGAMARRPGCQADSVFLWGVANFFLIGRNVMNMVEPTIDAGPAGLARADTVLDFWARTSQSYRGGDHLHAAEVGDRLDVMDVGDGQGPDRWDDAGRRRPPGPDPPGQRHHHQPPVPPLLRHPGGPRRHRPVPPRVTAAPWWSATTTASGTQRLLPGPAWPTAVPLLATSRRPSSWTRRRRRVDH